MTAKRIFSITLCLIVTAFQAQARSPMISDTEVVQLAALHAKAATTIGNFITEAEGLLPAYREELLNIARQRKAVDAKMPEFVTQKNKVTIHVNGLKPVELTVSTKPRTLIKLGGENIYFEKNSATKNVEQIERLIIKKFLLSRGPLSILLPEARALPAVAPVVVAVAAYVGIVGAVMTTVVPDFSREQCKAQGQPAAFCSFYSDASIIKLAKKAGIIDDFKCGEKGDLKTVKVSSIVYDVKTDREGRIVAVNASAGSPLCNRKVNRGRIIYQNDNYCSSEPGDLIDTIRGGLPFTRMSSCCQDKDCLLQVAAAGLNSGSGAGATSNSSTTR